MKEPWKWKAILRSFPTVLKHKVVLVDCGCTHSTQLLYVVCSFIKPYEYYTIDLYTTECVYSMNTNTNCCLYISFNSIIIIWAMVLGRRSSVVALSFFHFFALPLNVWKSFVSTSTIHTAYNTNMYTYYIHFRLPYYGLFSSFLYHSLFILFSLCALKIVYEYGTHIHMHTHNPHKYVSQKIAFIRS